MMVQQKHVFNDIRFSCLHNISRISSRKCSYYFILNHQEIKQHLLPVKQTGRQETPFGKIMHMHDLNVQHERMLLANATDSSGGPSLSSSSGMRFPSPFFLAKEDPRSICLALGWQAPPTTLPGTHRAFVDITSQINQNNHRRITK
jgi:hypothetical protein